MQRSALIGPQRALYSTAKARKPASVASVALPHRRFTPRDPGARPLDLFAPAPSPLTRAPRLTSTTDPSQLLLFAHGIHRRTGPGGVGVFFSPAAATPSANFAAAIIATHTPASAPLHAAIAALRLRDWRAEGFRGVVLATSAPALVDGIAGRAAVWERTGGGGVVENRALWTELCDAVRELEARGTRVRFWNVRRELNLAVGLAGLAAGPEEEEVVWEELPPVEVQWGPGRRTMACIVVGVATFMIYLAATKKW